MAQQPQALRYKIFRTDGTGDFLRTRAGDVQQFTDLAEAQKVSAEIGGIVLLWESSAPGGFDRSLSG